MAIQNQTIDWATELESHREWMVRMAKQRLSDPDASEDIVHDIVLNVVKRNPQLEDPSKIRSWLYQAIVRRIADHVRKTCRLENLQENFLRTRTEPADLSGLDWVLSAEKQTQLQSAIDVLSQEDREIVLLKFVENWSYKQLGERFGLTERAVEYRLVGAKRQLRSELTKQRSES